MQYALKPQHFLFYRIITMYYCYSTGLLKTTPCATQPKINTKVILIHSELIKSHLLWLANKNRNVVGCSSPWLHNWICFVSMLCFLSVTCLAFSSCSLTLTHSLCRSVKMRCDLHVNRPMQYGILFFFHLQHYFYTGTSSVGRLATIPWAFWEMSLRIMFSALQCTEWNTAFLSVVRV